VKTKENKMKVMIRLAVIFAALLGISNLAFADSYPDCTGDQVVCYNFYYTLPNGTTAGPGIFKFCLNDDGTGGVCEINEGCYEYLKAFGGGTGWYNFDGDPQYSGNPNWSLWVAHSNSITSIFQPFGDGYYLTGVLTLTGPNERRIISGTKVKCP
jgi:hypothetical protein